MKQIRSKPLSYLAVLILLVLATPVVMAQTTGTPTSAPFSTAPATATVPESRLVSSFTPLAGSTENAASLVKGLRSGTPIVLTGPGETPVAPPNTVTFVAPTRPMGYGNVRIALSLAKTQLASQGITQPTPQQLQGALMGMTTTTAGTGTTQQGILQMRASGMGWGQIANSMGVKLGTVMSGKSATTTGSVNAAGGHTFASSSGVTTAAGAQGKHTGTTTAEGTGGSSSKGITTGQGHGSASGGAVNAAGGSAGNMGAAAGAGVGHGAGGKKP